MKTKLLVVTTLLLLVVAVISASTSVPAKPGKSDRLANTNPAPDVELVNDLDRVIQLRFLTAPGFGMRRIGPNPNPHLESFKPNTVEETRAVNNLQTAQWKAGVYLFGRRGLPKPSENGVAIEKGLLVIYKFNNPVLLTRNFRKSDLASPKSLRDSVDEAFVRFKESDSYDFSLGKWSYVARPVRARETCLPCHQDLFASKLGERKYSYRPRRVGDPIGVLVYAFRKRVDRANQKGHDLRRFLVNMKA